MARTEDGVGGVHGDLVLGGVADEALGVGEGDVGGRGTVALVVGDDLDPVMLPHADAGEEEAIQPMASWIWEG